MGHRGRRWTHVFYTSSIEHLAGGVDDLKRLLSNVRARGTWGEHLLGNILEQILIPEQFEKNVEVVPGSNKRVEYAVRLPGDGAEKIWLPLDSKFNRKSYDRLKDAADRGDTDTVEKEAKELEKQIKKAAGDISEKYISPPYSTDFGVMFLPTEGLFSEVIRRPALTDFLQHEYRVAVAGPTTLAALLSALQMGFRTLAIQKRSSEVWRVLGAVKTEFGKYAEVLDDIKKRLRQASVEIDRRASRTRRRDDLPLHRLQPRTVTSPPVGVVSITRFVDTSRPHNTKNPGTLGEMKRFRKAAFRRMLTFARCATTRFAIEPTN